MISFIHALGVVDAEGVLHATDNRTSVKPLTDDKKLRKPMTSSSVSVSLIIVPDRTGPAWSFTNGPLQFPSL
jgi:hypothetical protein